MVKAEGNEGISKEKATGDARKVCIDCATRSKAEDIEVTRFWLEGRLFPVVDMYELA